MVAERDIIREVQGLITLAGVGPRDVAPMLGLSPSSMYRVLSGTAPTSSVTITAFRMYGKFLRLATSRCRVGDLPTRKDRVKALHTIFERWLNK